MDPKKRCLKFGAIWTNWCLIKQPPWLCPAAHGFMALSLHNELFKFFFFTIYSYTYEHSIVLLSGDVDTVFSKISISFQRKHQWSPSEDNPPEEYILYQSRQQRQPAQPVSSSLEQKHAAKPSFCQGSRVVWCFWIMMSRGVKASQYTLKRTCKFSLMCQSRPYSHGGHFPLTSRSGWEAQMSYCCIPGKSLWCHCLQINQQLNKTTGQIHRDTGPYFKV